MTSQRRPRKRQNINPNRTTISAQRDAQTPTMPQSNASAASDPTAHTTNAATIDHIRKGPSLAVPLLAAGLLAARLF